MLKKIGLIVVAALLLPLIFNPALAQQSKLEKSVMGSGGTVGAVSSSGTSKLYYITGQVAIEKKILDVSGDTNNLYQGFWVPSALRYTGVTDPITGLDEGINNYPNPFSSSTTIEYTLLSPSIVTLRIYDVSGVLINILIDGIQSAGLQKNIWNAKNMAGIDVGSGSYLYELKVTPLDGSGNSDSGYILHNIMILVK